MAKVSFSFRTTESDGLLLLAVKNDLPRVFVMIDVVNSTFRYMYNLGGGIRTLISSKTYSDGKFHKVLLQDDEDDEQYFSLNIDDEVMANYKRYYDTIDAEYAVEAKYVYFGGRDNQAPFPVGV
jgi:hypothetical protein